jgi:tyrosinase
VRAWNAYDDILDFGYVPVPALQAAYGSYPPMCGWFAIRHPDIADTQDAPLPRATLEGWRDNIYQAIKDGFFYTKAPDNTEARLALTPENAHNIVGIVIESESDVLNLPDGSSIDRDRYGNLHNFGHDKFAEIAYHKLSPTMPLGLMISNFGSPRDPSFWPWHKHIQYYGRLVAAKYPQDITEHRAQVTLNGLSMQGATANSITTWLGPPALDLMEANAKLDHEPYTWSVTVSSTRDPLPSVDAPQSVTLRFFIAATSLVEDYGSWIEMDKVTHTLNDAQPIVVTRRDVESSVARKMANYSEDDPSFSSTWCRCGWPQNMMLPAGNPGGMDFTAFVIATNDSLEGPVLDSAQSYCGVLQSSRKYPDPRGMGYPFDRVWTQQLQDPNKRGIRGLINDSKTFPFLASCQFKIYRTTQPLAVTSSTGPTSEVTWESDIKSFFLPMDVSCMKNEYGYDLSDYDDVVLHAGAIYDATFNKRMPLQMPPFTQEAPDPKHPLWTPDMCNKFKMWMDGGAPKGTPGDKPKPDPSSSVTWANTIAGFFLPQDAACMKRSFDLTKQADVAKNAPQIYDAVANKRMPLQMAPFTQENPDPNHPLWTADMCAKFKAWMDAGCP